jgi:hypothetical protein
MDDELNPVEAMVIEVANAAVRGEASGYSLLEVLAAAGGVWYCRRLYATESAIPHLDEALEMLGVELEAREVMGKNPFRDLPHPGDPGTS